VTQTPRSLKARVRQIVVNLVRWVARRRHRFPAPVNRALEWVRWHLPTGLAWRLTGRRGAPVDLRAITPEQELPPVPQTGTRLFVGPANFAGQGDLWVKAVRRFVPDAGGISYALHIPGGFDFPCDYMVTAVVYRKNAAWQRELFEYVASGFTHVMIEAGRPLFADLHRVNPFLEAKALAERGVAVAMMAHGTDVRLPSRHARAHPWSPFNDRDWDVVDQLEATAAKNLFNLGRFDGPVFVSTPDLLDDLPDATWCPVVVDPERWRNDQPLLERDVPVVAHVPSNSRVKGTEQVEAALSPLEADGLVTYERVHGVPSAQMPAVYTAADIVLDQFRLGSYGVAACEAMAAGKVVVGNVTTQVRERVRELTGQDLPIVQAEPDTIEEVVRDLVTDRERAREVARRGPAFVTSVHDGRFSTRQLGAFLGSAA
jgi:Glycosyl transferases group 1